MSRIKALKNKISKLQQKLDKQIATEAINKECVLRLSQNLDKLMRTESDGTRRTLFSHQRAISIF